MDVGEIPDSDPGVPVLDETSPVWVDLGRTWAPESSSLGPTTAEIPHPKRRKASNLTSRANGSVETETSQMPQPGANEQFQGSSRQERAEEASPIREREVVALESRLDPHAESANVSITSSEYAPRRRRFDFAKWVQEDRRTHEYVYRRRFRNFHGALSDSEDEDYADLQNVASQNQDEGEQFYEDEEGESAEIEESREQPSDGQSDESQGDMSSDSNIDQHSAAYHLVNRRSRRIVDSDFSDSGEESDNDVIPIFERKLKRSIPAIAQLSESNAASLPDSLSESQSDVSSQSQIGDFRAELPLLFAGTALPDGEALEDYGGIDYMMTSRRSEFESGKRKNKRPFQVDLKELARRAGQNASRALRVAARTSALSASRSKVKKRPGENRQIRSTRKANEPRGKLFVNQDQEAMQTLRNWEQNKYRDTNSLAAATFSEGHISFPLRDIVINSNRQNEQPSEMSTRRITKEGRRQIPPSFHSKSIPSLQRKRKPRPKPRYVVEPNPNRFRTTIIERALPKPTVPLQSNVERFPASGSTYETANKQPSKSIGIDPLPKHFGKTHYSRQKVHVKMSLPRRHLALHEFDRSTFVGSNMQELLAGPILWDGVKSQTESSLFKTPVCESTEIKVATDAASILELCNADIDPETYDALYNYFLEGCAFLIDESEIVEQGFREFVLHEWLRLARTLLKVSIRQGWLSSRHIARSNRQLMTAQLVSVAVAFLHHRVGMLTPNAANSNKVKQLVGWIAYYHQFEISRQIDGPVPDTRHRIGAELIYLCQKMKLFGSIARIFTKSRDSRANWHMLILLSSVDTHWSDWELARQLVSADIQSQQEIRTSMLYIQRLLFSWHWPACAEIVIDLFTYYSKQQHYADPRGESIWLPSSLWASDFDGARQPEEDFSMFLELLGLTLRKLSREPMSALRLAGRVTPLSALSFPESKEVSLSDLSSASHQYGILIVLLRVLEGAGRPSVAQFRDLVVLKDAHWAIKVKAVSAWSIVARLCGSFSELEECKSWMADDILCGDHLPEALKVAALRSSIELIPDAVASIPRHALVEVGLKSQSKEVRHKAWELCLNLASGLKIEDIPYFPHFESSDFEWVSRLLIPHGASSINSWCTKNLVPRSAELFMYSWLLKTGGLRACDLELSKPGLIIDILMELAPTKEESELLSAAGYGIRIPHLERKSAVLRFLAKSRNKLSEADMLSALQKSKETLDVMSPVEAAEYLPAAAELRLVAFAKYPHLSRDFAVPQNRAIHVLETMQQNILNYVHRKDFSCYYYFAYRLQNCCDFKSDGNDTAQEADTFVAELLRALKTGEKETDMRISHLIFNYLFASFFDMASYTYDVTLRSKVSYMLPILVKSAIANIGRGTKLEFQCTRFLIQAMRYLKGRFRIDPKIAFHPPTTLLIQLLATLGTSWIHQNAANDAKFGKVSMEMLRLFRVIFRDISSSDRSSMNEYAEIALDDLLMAEPTSDVYSLHGSTDPIAAFQTSEVDDLITANDQQRKLLSQSIQTLIRHIVTYSAVSSTV